MDKTLLSLLVIVLLSLIGVIGDFFIKLSGVGPKFVELKWFVLGFIIYAATAFGWFFVMKNVKLSTLGVFYAVSTVIFLVAVGVFYFKEQLNVYEIIAIIAAVVSLIILARFA
ncbi:MAG: transporter [archaeon]|nr:transporter [archaeon]